MAKHPYPKWDLQHHAVPRAYVSALAERGITKVGGIPFPKWSIRTSLGMMNAWNVEPAILSVSCPGVHFGDDAAARDLGMEGVILMSNVDGRYIADPSYRPLFERLNEDGALVFIHPNTGPAQLDCDFLNPFYWWSRATPEVRRAGAG